MNRQNRQKAAALGRRGYMHRLVAASARGWKPTAGVHHGMIEHDAWCTIYKGGPCNCVPHISISGPDGAVTVIDENGNPKRVAKQ